MGQVFVLEEIDYELGSSLFPDAEVDEPVGIRVLVPLDIIQVPLSDLLLIIAQLRTFRKRITGGIHQAEQRFQRGFGEHLGIGCRIKEEFRQGVRLIRIEINTQAVSQFYAIFVGIVLCQPDFFVGGADFCKQRCVRLQAVALFLIVKCLLRRRTRLRQVL